MLRLLALAATALLFLATPMILASIGRPGRCRVRTPLRSTKADAKRAAHRYAEEVVGGELSWKQARRLLAKWDRQGKAAEHLV